MIYYCEHYRLNENFGHTFIKFVFTSMIIIRKCSTIHADKHSDILNYQILIWQSKISLHHTFREWTL